MTNTQMSFSEHMASLEDARDFEGALPSRPADVQFVAQEVDESGAGRMTNPASILTFVMAGRAKFTLVSSRTAARFTFKVSQPKDMDPNSPIHFVSLLTGQDNESSYSYFGYIKRGVFYHGRAKAKVAESAPSVKAFTWFYQQLIQADRNRAIADGVVEFWHEGSCGRCGRTLTVPESIASGFGPECIGRI